MMRRRFKKVAVHLGQIAAAGTAYLFLYQQFAARIPCPFHALTGLYCPGCGISRCFVCLSRLDFAGAFYFHPALLAAMPLLAFFYLRRAYRYIRFGSAKMTRGENFFIYGMIVYFLLFAVIKNLAHGKMIG